MWTFLVPLHISPFILLSMRFKPFLREDVSQVTDHSSRHWPSSWWCFLEQDTEPQFAPNGCSIKDQWRTSYLLYTGLRSSRWRVLCHTIVNWKLLLIMFQSFLFMALLAVAAWTCNPVIFHLLKSKFVAWTRITFLAQQGYIWSSLKKVVFTHGWLVCRLIALSAVILKIINPIKSWRRSKKLFMNFLNIVT